MSPHLEDSNQFFSLHDTPDHTNAPPYQVWLQKVEWFRCPLDKAGQMTMDSVIPESPLPHLISGVKNS